MKVCTYKRQTPIGVLYRVGFFYNKSTIVDVNLLWKTHFEQEGGYDPHLKAKNFAPEKLSELLKLKDEPISFFQESFELFEKLTKKGLLHTKDKGYFSFDLNDDKLVSLGAPIDKINCYRDFYVHEKHVKKGFEKRKEPVPEAWYEMPVFYKGPSSGFIGPDDMVPWPSFTNKLDYELELGVVIGKQGTNLKAKEAYKKIFGLTVLNDISARDIQKKEMSVRLGPAKGKDFCSVIGPVITTMDEFNFEEPKLEMTAKINDVLWSKGSSGDAYYSWGEMIEHLTKDEWVFPTDFLGSGTVGTGCGLELDKWIQPGDLVELEIEKIGVLRNIIGTPNKG